MKKLDDVVPCETELISDYRVRLGDRRGLKNSTTKSSFNRRSIAQAEQTIAAIAAGLRSLSYPVAG